MANKPKYQKFGYTLEPSYADKQELKRLQLVPKGDKVTQLFNAVQERENDYIDKLKQVQNELTKVKQKQTTNMSKAQLKKQEKAY